MSKRNLIVINDVIRILKIKDKNALGESERLSLLSFKIFIGNNCEMYLCRFSVKVNFIDLNYAIIIAIL